MNERDNLKVLKVKRIKLIQNKSMDIDAASENRKKSNFSSLGSSTSSTGSIRGGGTANTKDIRKLVIKNFKSKKIMR